MAQIDFENLLKAAIGLDSASVGSASIGRAIRLRMTSLGVSQLDDYWEKVVASDDELQELIEAVVVPETWFFRDPEAFTTLARLVTEEWLQGHPAQALRLLSVPCCTGEEPYSMAMALLDAGLSQDKLKIDAVEISLRALIRARRGVYGANSFRGDSLAFRERYFEPAAKGHSVVERIRGMVAFHHGNLLSPDFPARSAPYDVIFCRNLLIYFDRDTQVRAMEILGRLLTPSGYLFVGPSEAFLAASTGFKSINQSMCFAFRRNSAAPAERAIAGRTRATVATTKAPRRQARPVIKPQIPAPLLPPPTVPASIDLAAARRLGDSGRFAEAAELCEAHLKQQGPTSETYHLLGLVKDALGDLKRAGEYYRKALYLEPNHSEALLHLALLSDKQGDAGGAERLRERARRIEKGDRT